MILVLRVGALVLVRAEVHGNVAVVARELAVKDAKSSHVLVVEGGEGDGEAVEVVRQSEHLALRVTRASGPSTGRGDTFCVKNTEKPSPYKCAPYG